MANKKKDLEGRVQRLEALVAHIMKYGGAYVGC
jgi:hypothetical protein